MANPGQRMLSTLGEVVAASKSHTIATAQEVLTLNDLTVLAHLAAEPFDGGLVLERLMNDAHQD
ncbi:hypothetical protein ACWDB3_09385 [Streptomyces bacillaris]|uniref:hypothetical protein n=1 Tax=Streptomyces sp. NPDC056007 TaxID=3345678 RepID=UPI0035DB2E2A